MTHEEHSDLITILTSRVKPWDNVKNALQYVSAIRPQEVPENVSTGQIEPNKSTRTGDQNSALHLYFRLLSDALNEAGLTVQEILAKAMDMEWTEYRVKEILWKNSQKKLFGKASTTQLSKTKEIDLVYDHLNRYLAQDPWNMESIPFPNDPNKGKVKLAQMENLKDTNYPEYSGPPTI